LIIPLREIKNNQYVPLHINPEHKHPSYRKKQKEILLTYCCAEEEKQKMLP
jgi:hypothetical protein